MSDSADHKHEQALTPQEAARLLRELAEQLERGVLVLEQREVRLEHALVLEQSLKPEDQGLAYKLKLKYRPAGGPDSHPRPARQTMPASSQGEPSGRDFKELKRSLGRTFKEAKAALTTGGLPAPATARGLWDICRLLAAQAGAQDPGFMELERQAGLLLQAVEQGGAAGAGQAVLAMDRLKAACHAKKK
ncbi:MAG: hypothetical protein HY910_02405 [Desulfarculus sp.]|nr:hypothetical protein [Desulfarculus sp.]